MSQPDTSDRQSAPTLTLEEARQQCKDNLQKSEVALEGISSLKGAEAVRVYPTVSESLVSCQFLKVAPRWSQLTGEHHFYQWTQASACRPMCIMPHLSLKDRLSMVAYVFHSYNACIFHKVMNLFHSLSGALSLRFSLYSLAILLDISLIIPSTFIAIFILIPWSYHWIFHCLSLPLSLRFSFIFPGNIIGYFIVDLWCFHCDFHYYPCAILLHISFYISSTFFVISFISLCDIIPIP